MGLRWLHPRHTSGDSRVQLHAAAEGPGPGYENLSAGQIERALSRMGYGSDWGGATKKELVGFLRNMQIPEGKLRKALKGSSTTGSKTKAKRWARPGSGDKGESWPKVSLGAMRSVLVHNGIQGVGAWTAAECVRALQSLGYTPSQATRQASKLAAKSKKAKRRKDRRRSGTAPKEYDGREHDSRRYWKSRAEADAGGSASRKEAAASSAGRNWGFAETQDVDDFMQDLWEAEERTKPFEDNWLEDEWAAKDRQRDRGRAQAQHTDWASEWAPAGGDFVYPQGTSAAAQRPPSADEAMNRAVCEKWPVAMLSRLQASQLLGLRSEHPRAQEVRAARRQLAAKWHPDKHPGDAKAAEAFRLGMAAADLLAAR